MEPRRRGDLWRYLECGRASVLISDESAESAALGWLRSSATRVCQRMSCRLVAT
jgi:hypothetical protein